MSTPRPGDRVMMTRDWFHNGGELRLLRGNSGKVAHVLPSGKLVVGWEGKNCSCVIDGSMVVVVASEEQTGMHASRYVFVINPDVRCVEAIYNPGDKPQQFKTVDKTIRKEDLIVVPTDPSHRVGCTTARVTDVDVDIDPEGSTEVKWVMGKVDEAGYKATLRMEEEAISQIRAAEMRKKRNDLRKKMLDHKAAGIMESPMAKLGHVSSKDDDDDDE
jgi:hypothetical protein